VWLRLGLRQGQGLEAQFGLGKDLVLSNIRFFLCVNFPEGKLPFTKNKIKGQPSMLVRNQLSLKQYPSFSSVSKFGLGLVLL
jgi:hypothetical protein